MESHKTLQDSSLDIGVGSAGGGGGWGKGGDSPPPQLWDLNIQWRLTFLRLYLNFEQKCHPPKSKHLPTPMLEAKMLHEPKASALRCLERLN